MGILYTIFGFILRAFYNLCGGNFIPALILFTLFAKLLMLPMSFTQQKNSIKTMKMKPELDEIRRKYANNQQKMQEETQKVYQKYNYKMSAGCLPLLIQLPVIYGLFGVIYYPMTYVLNMSAADIVAKAQEVLPNITGDRAIDLVTTVANTDAASYNAATTARGAEIFIAKGAELIDFDLFGVIDLAGTPNLMVFNWLWFIPLAAGLSAMLSGYVSSKLNGTELNGSMKGMIFGMPIISVVFAFSLPATIGFYWTLSSLLQIPISFAVKKLYSPEREERKEAAKREKERAEKLERLRRLHGDDDDAPQEPVIAAERAAIKDDPEKRDVDGTQNEPQEEQKLTKKQKKELTKKRLSESRNRDK